MEKDFLDLVMVYTSPKLIQLELKAEEVLLSGSAQVEGSTIESWADGNDDWFTM